jgi:hypothetical protein
VPCRHQANLPDLLPLRGLPGAQKRFDQLAVAANGHAWKAFKPSARRHLRLLIKPSGQQAQLAGGNVALLDAIEQVMKQRR